MSGFEERDIFEKGGKDTCHGNVVTLAPPVYCGPLQGDVLDMGLPLDIRLQKYLVRRAIVVAVELRCFAVVRMPLIVQEGD